MQNVCRRWWLCRSAWSVCICINQLVEESTKVDSSIPLSQHLSNFAKLCEWATSPSQVVPQFLVASSYPIGLLHEQYHMLMQRARL